MTNELRLGYHGLDATNRAEWESLVDQTPVPPDISQRFDTALVDRDEGIRSSFVTIRDSSGRLVGGVRLTVELRLPARYFQMIGGPLFLPDFELPVRSLVCRAIRETVTVADSAMIRPSPGHPWGLSEFGLHRTGVPAETVRVDLRPPEDALWRAVDHSVRQGVRKARDHGLTIRELTDPAEIERFYPVLDRFGRNRDFEIISESRMRAMHRQFGPRGAWHVLVGEEGPKPAGVAIIWITNQLAGLLVLASAPEYANLQLTSLLAWESMRNCRAWGATLFDFLGLPPAGSGLAGVRRFKLKWGGQVVGGEEYLEGVVFRSVVNFVRRHPNMFNSVLMARGPFRGGVR